MEEFIVKNKKNLLLFISLLAFAVFSSGCGMIYGLMAKDRLNEGVREFNKGKYEKAKTEFKNAIDYSPDVKNGQFFYARALHELFKQDLTEDSGLQTIAEYEKVIQSGDEERKDGALAFEAAVYDQLVSVVPAKAQEYTQKRYESLLKRASLPNATPEVKSAVYAIIGTDKYNACYRLSSSYERAGYAQIPPDVVAKMKPLISEAHMYLQKAIAENPDNSSPVYYDGLTFLEEAKIETDPAKKEAFKKKKADRDKDYEAAEKRARAKEEEKAKQEAEKAAEKPKESK